MKDTRNDSIPKIKSKSTKKNISSWAHTPKSAKGMGDYYGTGITAKIGRQIEGIGFKNLTDKKMKTPPKNLA